MMRSPILLTLTLTVIVGLASCQLSISPNSFAAEPWSTAYDAVSVPPGYHSLLGKNFNPIPFIPTWANPNPDTIVCFRAKSDVPASFSLGIEWISAPGSPYSQGLFSHRNYSDPTHTVTMCFKTGVPDYIPTIVSSWHFQIDNEIFGSNNVAINGKIQGGFILPINLNDTVPRRLPDFESQRFVSLRIITSSNSMPIRLTVEKDMTVPDPNWFGVAAKLYPFRMFYDGNNDNDLWNGGFRVGSNIPYDKVVNATIMPHQLMKEEGDDRWFAYVGMNCFDPVNPTVGTFVRIVAKEEAVTELFDGTYGGGMLEGARADFYKFRPTGNNAISFMYQHFGGTPSSVVDIGTNITNEDWTEIFSTSDMMWQSYSLSPGSPQYPKDGGNLFIRVRGATNQHQMYNLTVRELIPEELALNVSYSKHLDSSSAYLVKFNVTKYMAEYSAVKGTNIAQYGYPPFSMVVNRVGGDQVSVSFDTVIPPQTGMSCGGPELQCPQNLDPGNQMVALTVNPSDPNGRWNRYRNSEGIIYVYFKMFAGAADFTFSMRPTPMTTINFGGGYVDSDQFTPFYVSPWSGSQFYYPAYFALDYDSSVSWPTLMQFILKFDVGTQINSSPELWGNQPLETQPYGPHTVSGMTGGGFPSSAGVTYKSGDGNYPSLNGRLFFSIKYSAQGPEPMRFRMAAFSNAAIPQLDLPFVNSTQSVNTFIESQQAVFYRVSWLTDMPLPISIPVKMRLLTSMMDLNVALTGIDQNPADTSCNPSLNPCVQNGAGYGFLRPTHYLLKNNLVYTPGITDQTKRHLTMIVFRNGGSGFASPLNFEWSLVMPDKTSLSVGNSYSGTWNAGNEYQYFEIQGYNGSAPLMVEFAGYVPGSAQIIVSQIPYPDRDTLEKAESGVNNGFASVFYQPAGGNYNYPPYDSTKPLNLVLYDDMDNSNPVPFNLSLTEASYKSQVALSSAGDCVTFTGTLMMNKIEFHEVDFRAVPSGPVYINVTEGWSIDAGMDQPLSVYMSNTQKFPVCEGSNGDGQNCRDIEGPSATLLETITTLHPFHGSATLGGKMGVAFMYSSHSPDPSPSLNYGVKICYPPVTVAVNNVPYTQAVSQKSQWKYSTFDLLGQSPVVGAPVIIQMFPASWEGNAYLSYSLPYPGSDPGKYDKQLGWMMTDHVKTFYLNTNDASFVSAKSLGFKIGTMGILDPLYAFYTSVNVTVQAPVAVTVGQKYRYDALYDQNGGSHMMVFNIPLADATNKVIVLTADPVRTGFDDLKLALCASVTYPSPGLGNNTWSSFNPIDDKTRVLWIYPSDPNLVGAGSNMYAGVGAINPTNQRVYTFSSRFVTSTTLVSGTPVANTVIPPYGAAFYDATPTGTQHLRVAVKIIPADTGVDMNYIKVIGCATAFCRNDAAIYQFNNRSVEDEFTLIGDLRNVNAAIHLSVVSNTNKQVNATVTVWFVTHTDLTEGAPVSRSLLAGSEDLDFFRFTDGGCSLPFNVNVNITVTSGGACSVYATDSDTLSLPRKELYGSVKWYSESSRPYVSLDVSSLLPACQIYFGVRCINTKSDAPTDYTLTARVGRAAVIPQFGIRTGALRNFNNSLPGLKSNPTPGKLETMQDSMSAISWFKINPENTEQLLFGPPNKCVLMGLDAVDNGFQVYEKPWTVFWSETAGNRMRRLCVKMENSLGGDVRVCTNSAYADGNWHQIAVVRDVASFQTVSLYVDGVLVSSKSNTGGGPHDYAGTEPHYIGTCSGGGDFIDGWIDEVSFWSVPLSPADIAMYYTTKVTAPKPGLLGLWSMSTPLSLGADDTTTPIFMALNPSGTGAGWSIAETAPVDSDILWTLIEDTVEPVVLAGWSDGGQVITNAEIVTLPPAEEATLIDMHTGLPIVSVPHMLQNATVLIRPAENLHSVNPATPITSFMYRVKNTEGSFGRVGKCDIIVHAVNDHPIVFNLTGNTVLSTGDKPLKIDPAFNFTDDALATPSTVITATLEVLPGGFGNFFSLPMPGVTLTGNIGSDPRVRTEGTMTFNGALSEVQAAVRVVRFEPSGGMFAPVRIKLTIFDGGSTHHGGGGLTLSGDASITINVDSRGKAATTTAHGAGLSFGVAGVPVTAIVQARDAYGNNRTSAGETWTGSNVASGTLIPAFSYVAGGLYSMSWATNTAGMYKVEIKLNGVAIGSAAGQPSSHNVSVVPNTISHLAGGVMCGLPVGISLRENEPIQMTFDARDQYGNLRLTGDDAGAVSLAIKNWDDTPCVSPTCVVSGTTTYVYNGKYSKSFTIADGGTYKIDVRVNGQVATESSCAASFKVATTCEAGMYPNAYAGTCQRCPGGTASNATMTMATETSPALACLDCAVGTYAPDPTTETTGRDVCIPCPAGEYTNDVGKKICSKCTDVQYQDLTGQTSCKTCPTNSRSLIGATAETDCSCGVGFYASTASGALTCVACPTGATCKGGSTGPVANAGYYAASSTQFVECVPATACVGGNDPTASCSIGYTGRMCGKCITGYYQMSNLCNKCPNNSLVILIVILAGVVVLMAGMMKLQSMGLSFASITIMVSFMQLTTLFSRFNMNWPTLVLEFFNILSVFNLNIDVAAPECTIQLTYYEKLILKLLMPFAVIFMLVSLVAILAAIEFLVELTPIGKRRRLVRARAAALKKKKEDAVKEKIRAGAELDEGSGVVAFSGPVGGGRGVGVDHIGGGPDDATPKPPRVLPYAVSLDDDTIDDSQLDIRASSCPATKKILNYAVNGGVQVLVILYVYVTSTSLDFFKCSQVGDSFVLDVQKDLDCYTPEYYAMQPIALVAAISYATGIPVVASVILWKIRRNIRNPVVAARFGGLFKKYGRGRWYWEVVIMMRKLSVIAAAMFATEIMIQSVIGIGFLFAFLLAQTFARPYADSQHNLIEFIGLVANVLTLFAGILFYSGKLTKTTSDIVTIVTIIAVIISGVSFTLIFFMESGKAYKILRSGRFRKLIRQASKRFGRKGGKSQVIEFMELLSNEERDLVEDILPKATGDHLRELSADERAAVFKLLRVMKKK